MFHQFPCKNDITKPLVGFGTLKQGHSCLKGTIPRVELKISAQLL